ncbi:MAG TPA: S8 family peptidase [Vicinamibacterales bacterium]|nr:S8 family peptidase [Vicinamibacterales bacterium]
MSSILLLAIALVAPQPLDAAQKSRGAAKAGAQPSQAEHKLDTELRGRAAKGAGETDVIVEFNDNRDDADVVRGFGPKGKRLGLVNGRVLRVPNALLSRLAEHPRVKRIHHDRPVASDVARTGLAIGSRAVVALMGYTGAGVGVAVIDSGITGWHDDLRIKGYWKTQPTSLTLASESLESTGLVLPTNQRVADFQDFVNGRTTAYDDWGHGTHVTGIIAGNGFDSVGIREGIAPGAHIVSLKALDANGAGSISNVIAAIEYAIVNKALYNIRVINMSLSAGVRESYHIDPLTQAAKRAVEAGIVVVASAGNMGKAKDGSPQYGAIGAPGNAPWVLTVGASSTQGTIDRRDDIMASYSSRGPTIYDHAAKPDIVAPGTGTVSLSDPNSRMYVEKASFLTSGLIGGLGYKPYLTLSGTSMAAPVVAGTVALMLHANPSLTPNMVKAMLQFTAQVYSKYDYLTQGAGFVNARGAVVLARYFAQGTPGTAYPAMTGWSRHILWGNYRVSGGVLTPNGTAWANNIVWGDSRTPTGANIVWGDNCGTSACDDVIWGDNIVWGQYGDDNIVWGQYDDNIVWGNSDGDSIVWGNGDIDNIVWGQFDNIVWGNDCGGSDCDNIVWGQMFDNIVWGNAEGIDNIVWGNFDSDNIVWGNSDEGDNIVWGNSADEVFFDDEVTEVESFDPTVWDALFESSLSEVSAPDSSTTTTTTTDEVTTTTDSTTELLEGGLQ